MVAVILALPAPAQAHDTLLSTDPEDGSTLETSPEAITFTFSADVLEVSPLVRITDESGEEVAEIEPSVEGPTATATLPEPLAAGTYEIQWRVVSGDGHPIEGTLTLTVEQDPADEGESAEESAEPSDGGGEDAEAAEQSPQGSSASDAGSDSAPAEAAESEDSGGLSMPVLLGVLAVLVIGAVIAVVAIVRRRD